MVQMLCMPTRPAYGCAAIASRLPALVSIHDAPVTILRYHPDVYRLVRLALAGRVRAARPALTAVSPYAASRWAREMLDRGPVDIIPNVAPSFTVDRAMCPDGRRRVVMMGSSAGLKNMDAGISAFLRAATGRTDLELVVIGPGLGAGLPFAQKYSNRLANVTFLGELTAPQVHNELAIADLLVHPSLEETQGMVLLEAMRAGVPVVGGACSGGVPWTLDDGSAGRLVDVRSPRRMSEAILAVLDDQALAVSYVARAHELLESRFSAAVVGAAYVAAYERAANRRP